MREALVFPKNFSFIAQFTLTFCKFANFFDLQGLLLSDSF